MMCVRETIKYMSREHLAEVRAILALDKAYNRFTLCILITTLLS